MLPRSEVMSSYSSSTVFIQTGNPRAVSACQLGAAVQRNIHSLFSHVDRELLCPYLRKIFVLFSYDDRKLPCPYWRKLHVLCFLMSTRNCYASHDGKPPASCLFYCFFFSFFFPCRPCLHCRMLTWNCCYAMLCNDGKSMSCFLVSTGTRCVKKRWASCLAARATSWGTWCSTVIAFSVLWSPF